MNKLHLKKPASNGSQITFEDYTQNLVDIENYFNSGFTNSLGDLTVEDKRYPLTNITIDNSADADKETGIDSSASIMTSTKVIETINALKNTIFDTKYTAILTNGEVLLPTASELNTAYTDQTKGLVVVDLNGNTVVLTSVPDPDQPEQKTIENGEGVLVILESNGVFEEAGFANNQFVIDQTKNELPTQLSDLDSRITLVEGSSTSNGILSKANEARIDTNTINIETNKVSTAENRAKGVDNAKDIATLQTIQSTHDTSIRAIRAEDTNVLKISNGKDITGYGALTTDGIVSEPAKLARRDEAVSALSSLKQEADANKIEADKTKVESAATKLIVSKIAPEVSNNTNSISDNLVIGTNNSTAIGKLSDEDDLIRARLDAIEQLGSANTKKFDTGIVGDDGITQPKKNYVTFNLGNAPSLQEGSSVDLTKIPAASMVNGVAYDSTDFIKNADGDWPEVQIVVWGDESLPAGNLNLPLDTAPESEWIGTQSFTKIAAGRTWVHLGTSHWNADFKISATGVVTVHNFTVNSVDVNGTQVPWPVKRLILVQSTLELNKRSSTDPYMTKSDIEKEFSTQDTVSRLDARVVSNTTNIASNVSDIAANASDVKSNATNIASNVADIKLKQSILDNSLTTVDKRIPVAINELKTRVDTNGSDVGHIGSIYNSHNEQLSDMASVDSEKTQLAIMQDVIDADNVITNDYTAADTAITTAYKAADTAITTAYKAADTAITTAYKAADTVVLNAAKADATSKDTAQKVIIDAELAKKQEAEKQAILTTLGYKETVVPAWAESTTRQYLLAPGSHNISIATSAKKWVAKRLVSGFNKTERNYASGQSMFSFGSSYINVGAADQHGTNFHGTVSLSGETATVGGSVTSGMGFSVEYEIAHPEKTILEKK